MLQSGHEYGVEMAIFNVQRAITPKVCNPKLRLMRSARRLMRLNICVKFHENILNGFEVTEWTRVCGKNAIFLNVQMAITPKECNPELHLLRSAHRLFLLNICAKFQENISIELRRGQGFVIDRQTDRLWTPMPETICLRCLRGET